MKTDFSTEPRKFWSDQAKTIEISDYGKIKLEPNEMISFQTCDGKEYDVARKSWGFYATPSVNSRLKNEGFKTALVNNSKGQLYIMLVEKGKMDDFHAYLEKEANEVVEWLDEKPTHSS
tara:strand:+ start:2980 stop:3336 length:357 start_codon:yes stop_codon:yes gene_type:complete